MSKKAVIISINSDIGYYFAEKLIKQNYKIIGTYRKFSSRLKKLKKNGVILKKINFSKNISKNQIQNILKYSKGWNLLLNFVGNQKPIGKISNLKDKEIIESFNVNFVSQFIITKEMLKLRKKNSFVLFFAGGGVNNPTKYYSPYTISKIALIKLVELLDFEIKDSRFSIIGPGWVNTKIHKATLKSNHSGKNRELTKKKLKSKKLTSMEQIYNFFQWLYSQNKKVSSGRNFSVVHDKYNKFLQKKLFKNSNLFKLRRSGN